MKRFNLSAWAVAHPTLILFFIVMLGIAGFFSYQRLGRAEDPSFTIKVVIINAMWPGATAKEMQEQVADPSFFGQSHDRTQQVLAQLAEAEQALDTAFERWEYLEGLKNGA